MEEARRNVAAATEQARAQLEAAAHSLLSAHRDDLLRRFQEQRALLDARAAEFELLSDAVSEGLEQGLARRYLSQFFFRDPGTRLERLRELVRGWEQEPAILGSELNYVRGALQAQPLPTGKVTRTIAASGRLIWPRRRVGDRGRELSHRRTVLDAGITSTLLTRAGQLRR